MSSVTIEGIQSVMEGLDRIRLSVLVAGADALNVVTDRVLADAKEAAPIGTPESTGMADYIISASYQRSIRKTPFEMTYDKKRLRRGVTAGGLIINPNTGRPVDYAIPLEFGRSKQAPQRPEGAVLGYSLHRNAQLFLQMMYRAMRMGIISA